MQLLLYIEREGGISKSRIVKKIELRFLLLCRKANLVLSAPIGAAASNIEKTTIHTCLRIDIKNNQGKSNIVSSI